MSRASGQVSFCDAPNMSRCRSSPTLSTSTRCPGPSGEKVLSTRVGRAGWMARRPIAVVLFFPSSRRIVFATPSVPSGFGFWLRSETYVRALPAYPSLLTPSFFPPCSPSEAPAQQRRGWRGWSPRPRDRPSRARGPVPGPSLPGACVWPDGEEPPDLRRGLHRGGGTTLVHRAAY